MSEVTEQWRSSAGSHFGRALSLFVLFSVRRIGGRLLRNLQILLDGRLGILDEKVPGLRLVRGSLRVAEVLAELSCKRETRFHVGRKNISLFQVNE